MWQFEHRPIQAEVQVCTERDTDLYFSYCFTLNHTYINRQLMRHLLVPYFPAHKTHPDFFSLEILEKNNDECILILVIYWKKTGLSHTKISNHNIIYSYRNPENRSHCH